MVTGEVIVVILVVDGEAVDEVERLFLNFRLDLSPSSCCLHNFVQTKKKKIRTMKLVQP